MRKKRTVAMISAVLFLAVVAVPEVTAADVRVTIPDFTVTLNSKVMDNDYSEYPLIVYKDITYFPMTYHGCRFLGLETNWSQQDGLKVEKTGFAGAYDPYKVSEKNQSSHNASIADILIQVNGEVIDNSKEEYPLLEFRGVTYFPLTWRFAVDSFGWQYEYTDSAGLIIQSEGFSPSNVEPATAATAGGREVILPVVQHEYELGKFTQAGDYYYYEAVDGEIYQAPTANPADRKKVFDVPVNDYYGDVRKTVKALETIDGQAYLTYRIGTDTKGHSYLVHLKEDGTSSEIISDNFVYQEADGTAVYYTIDGPPVSNNLYVREKGDSDFRKIGDEQYCYSGAILKGDYIYATGSTAYNKPAHLYRIHRKTGGTERLTEQPAAVFDMNDTTIYFVGEDNLLYQLPVAGGNAVKVSDVKVSFEVVAVLGDAVYYRDLNTGDLYKLGETVSLNPRGGFISRELTKENGYVKVKFISGDYSYMLLDANGVMAKSTEELVDLYLDGSTAVYVKHQ